MKPIHDDYLPLAAIPADERTLDQERSLRYAETDEALAAGEPLDTLRRRESTWLLRARFLNDVSVRLGRAPRWRDYLPAGQLADARWLQSWVKNQRRNFASRTLR